MFFREFWDEFQELIKQSSAYFAIAGGISQIDTFAPGPADIVSVTMLAAYNVATASFSTNNTIEDGLSGIANSFGTFRCKDAVDSMVDYLTRNGKRAEIITITFSGTRGYVWSDIAGATISENGVHVGLLYNGIVYCNVHPFGLPETSWINDFYGMGTKNVYKIPI